VRIMEAIEQILYFPLKEIPFIFVAAVLAFTIHEFAHAAVAYLFGDPTAKNEGRLTLNPLSHVDPVGLLLIFLIGFGWARPVPFNPYFFRNPRLATVLVALAGPFSNLLLAFLFIIIGVFQPDNSFVLELWLHIVFLNLTLFVFNLLPLPPLDGYQTIKYLSPRSVQIKMAEMENYGYLIFLLLAVTPLGDYVFGPIFETAIPFLYYLLRSPLALFM
jgi:Zn-dependent protease